MALFGDFDTGFTVTELTRYNRSLSGVRSDFAGERVSVSGFAARTDTGLVQDELQGDGTSGLYRLTRTPIVIGSDKLRIEVRDRFEITRVLETRELSRFIDYDLDYERGTVFFKEPVLSRDQELNPQFIVADYEVRSGGEEQTAAGVRVAAKFGGEKLEVGASAMYDGAQAGDTQIMGSDLTWRVTDGTRVRAEVAQSQSDDPLRPDSSMAWLVEGTHVSGTPGSPRLCARDRQRLRRRPAVHRRYGHAHRRCRCALQAQREIRGQRRSAAPADAGERRQALAGQRRRAHDSRFLQPGWRPAARGRRRTPAATRACPTRRCS